MPVSRERLNLIYILKGLFSHYLESVLWGWRTNVEARTEKVVTGKKVEILEGRAVV